MISKNKPLTQERFNGSGSSQTAMRAIFNRMGISSNPYMALRNNGWSPKEAATATRTNFISQGLLPDSDVPYGITPARLAHRKRIRDLNRQVIQCQENHQRTLEIAARESFNIRSIGKAMTITFRRKDGMPVTPLGNIEQTFKALESLSYLSESKRLGVQSLGAKAPDDRRLRTVYSHWVQHKRLTSIWSGSFSMPIFKELAKTKIALTNARSTLKKECERFAN